MHIFWEDFDFFDNYNWRLLIAEWVDCFLIFWSSWYFLEYYSLLNWCFQNRYTFESAWWLSLQFKHLNKWEHSLSCFVSSLSGLFEVSFVTSSKLLIILSLVWSITFDILGALSFVWESYMSPFLVIFALKNSQIYVCSLDSSNIVSYVKISVN